MPQNPKLFIWKAVRGLKQAFEQVLEEADEIIGYCSDGDDVKYLPEIYPAYYEKELKKNPGQSDYSSNRI